MSNEGSAISSIESPHIDRASIPTESSSSAATRVLFVYPPVRLNQPPRFPPFGMMYLGAALEEAGIHVELIDINLLRVPFEEVMAIIESRQFDVIGIGGMTTVYYYIKALSLHLKKRFPNIPIMGGGSAVSASPDLVLTNTGIDVACIGEGEPIIVQLVRHLSEGQDLDDIPGIAYRLADGSIRHTAPRPRFLDIDSLPFPAYHLVDLEPYISNNIKVNGRSPQIQARVEQLGIDPVKASRPIPLFSKRGCPFGCNFCYRNFGRKTAQASVDSVLDHMSMLEENYNTVFFVFSDEIFNVSKRWVTEFCERIIAEDRKYILATNNAMRANTVDREMLVIMKKAGFCQIAIGVESFYDPTLKAMEKNQTAETVANALRLARECDMFTNGAQLLFGYETDGRESMEANVKALTELGFSSVGFAIPCPYPGTALYDIAQKRGLLGDEEGWLLELADRDISDRMVNLSKMSDGEILRHIEWGNDQLEINLIRKRHPIVAWILDYLQPALRRLGGLNVTALWTQVWSILRYQRRLVRPESVYFDTGHDRTALRDEVFDLLEELDREKNETQSQEVRRLEPLT